MNPGSADLAPLQLEPTAFLTDRQILQLDETTGLEVEALDEQSNNTLVVFWLGKKKHVCKLL